MWVERGESMGVPKAEREARAEAFSSIIEGIVEDPSFEDKSEINSQTLFSITENDLKKTFTL